LSGYEFQQLVGSLLTSMGYVAKVGPRGKDAGVDILAHPDPFGFQGPRIKVQVKHRAGQATRPELQALSGTLHPGENGLFVSTAGFTKDAEAWANQSGKGITLLDGEGFVEILLEHYDHLDATAKSLIPLKLLWMPITT
jgi:restriction system protein